MLATTPTVALQCQTHHDQVPASVPGRASTTVATLCSRSAWCLRALSLESLKLCNSCKQAHDNAAQSLHCTRTAADCICGATDGSVARRAAVWPGARSAAVLDASDGLFDRAIVAGAADDDQRLLPPARANRVALGTATGVRAARRSSTAMRRSGRDSARWQRRVVPRRRDGWPALHRG